MSDIMLSLHWLYGSCVTIEAWRCEMASAITKFYEKKGYSFRDCPGVRADLVTIRDLMDSGF